MSTATEQDSGLISGLVNTSKQIGGALGIAVLASLSASHTSSLRHAGHPNTGALTAGYHLAFLIATLIVLTGAVLAAILLATQRTAPAHH